jgi:hypothetical protein
VAGDSRLSMAQILNWADAYHRRTGRWPRSNSGHIYGTALVADREPGDDREADLLAFLCWCFCQLALLFWLAVLTIRHLQRQLIELRCQANQ